MRVLMVATAVAWLLGGVLHRGPFDPAAGHRTERSVWWPHRDGLRRIRLRRRRRRVLHGGPARDGGLGVRAGRARGSLRPAESTGPIRCNGSVPSIAAVADRRQSSSRGPRPTSRVSQASDLTLAPHQLALALTAIGLTVDAVWGGWSQQALTGLVVELGDRDAAGTLRDRPSMPWAIGRCSSGTGLGGGWPVRGRRGRRLQLPGDGSQRRVTTIDLDGQPVAVLVHDAAVLAAPTAGRRGGHGGAHLGGERASPGGHRRPNSTTSRSSRRRLAESAGRQRLRVGREISAGPVASLARVRSLLGELPADPEAADVAEARRQLDRAVVFRSRGLRAGSPWADCWTAA